jgi:hypothetical protein
MSLIDCERHFARFYDERNVFFKHVQIDGTNIIPKPSPNTTIRSALMSRGDIVMIGSPDLERL